MNNNFTFEKVTIELNNIFKNLEEKLIEDVETNLNIKTRKRDITFIDALLYKFNYSIPKETKESLVSSYNYNNNTTLTQPCFEQKEKKISLSFYNKLFYDVSSLYKQLMNVDLNKPIIFSSDGTFNNINSLNKKDNLETALNMGFYDITNDIPLELNIEGIKNKNNELFLLKKYLKNSKIPLNSILVLDRAYCSYEFIDYLIKTKYKFIIRFRNNCKNFNKIQNLNNIRVLKYADEVKNIISYNKYKNYIDKKKEKEIKKIKKETKQKNIQLPNNDKYDVVFKNAEVIMKYEYTLLTNLNFNDYNDEKIKELYKQRWSIEIFFKLLKYNFKFEHLIEHNKNKDYEQYRKLYLVNLTLIYLSKIIEKTYFYNNYIKKDYKEIINNKVINYVYKPNRSNIIKGIYKILNPLFNSKFNEKNLIDLCNCYVKYKYSKLGEHKERKSKTPFLKWYVKGHSNRSLIYKFIEVFIFNNIEILNKNTKVLYKICKIKLNGLKKT